VVVVFIEDDDDELIRMAAEKGSFVVFVEEDASKHYFIGCSFVELENMFLILIPGIIQTPLWRTFDGGSPEDSMDDREVDSR